MDKDSQVEGLENVAYEEQPNPENMGIKKVGYSEEGVKLGTIDKIKMAVSDFNVKREQQKEKELQQKEIRVGSKEEEQKAIRDIEQRERKLSDREKALNANRNIVNNVSRAFGSGAREEDRRSRERPRGGGVMGFLGGGYSRKPAQRPEKKAKTITVNGKTYVRKDQAQPEQSGYGAQRQERRMGDNGINTEFINSVMRRPEHKQQIQKTGYGPTMQNARQPEYVKKNNLFGVPRQQAGIRTNNPFKRIGK
jgi:hypothetical protein